MPVTERSGVKVWRRRDRRSQFSIWLGWLLGTLLFVQAWRLVSEHTIWEFALDAPAQAWDLMVRMVPPRWPYIDTLWRPIWDTLNIATLGTLLGIVIAFPIAFLAARNTTPSLVFVRPAALLMIVTSVDLNINAADLD